MAKYIKKPIVVEACQWFKVSNHGNCFTRDVGYYADVNGNGRDQCKCCGRVMYNHGRISTLEGWRIVCPGD